MVWRANLILGCRHGCKGRLILVLRSEGQVNLVLAEKGLAGLWALALAQILGNLDINHDTLHSRPQIMPDESRIWRSGSPTRGQACTYNPPWTSFCLHDGRRHKIFWPHLHSMLSMKKLLLQVQLSESSTVSKPLRSCCKGEQLVQEPFAKLLERASVFTFPLGGLSTVEPSSAGRGLPGLLPPFLLWPMPGRQPGRNSPLPRVEKAVFLQSEPCAAVQGEALT